MYPRSIKFCLIVPIYVYKGIYIFLYVIETTDFINRNRIQKFQTNTNEAKHRTYLQMKYNVKNKIIQNDYKEMQKVSEFYTSTLRFFSFILNMYFEITL